MAGQLGQVARSGRLAGDARSGPGDTAQKVWWLPTSLLGRGSFRWAVLEAYGGQGLGTSAPFYLPSRAGEKLEIEVTLTP